MNEQNLEKLSALMDGELDAPSREVAIDTLLKDSSARQRWQRHHFISDALRRNLPRTVDHDLAAKVMAALKDEPTILAPPRREASSITRRVTGLAVAASVAVVGVLSVQFMYQSDGLVQPQGQIAQGPMTQELAAKGFQRPGTQKGIQLVEQTQSTQTSPRAQPNLGKYLLDHNQQTARSVQGVIPYARIVTYPNTVHRQDQAQGQR